MVAIHVGGQNGKIDRYKSVLLLVSILFWHLRRDFRGDVVF